MQTNFRKNFVKKFTKKLCKKNSEKILQTNFRKNFVKKSAKKLCKKISKKNLLKNPQKILLKNSQKILQKNFRKKLCKKNPQKNVRNSLIICIVKKYGGASQRRQVLRLVFLVSFGFSDTGAVATERRRFNSNPRFQPAGPNLHSNQNHHIYPTPSFCKMRKLFLVSFYLRENTCKIVFSCAKNHFVKKN